MIKRLLTLATELKRTIALSTTVLVTASSLFAFPDFEEAKSGADQGDAQAQAVVATYYAIGWQTAKDPALAARYAQQSAKAGNPLGKFRLGALLRNGEGVAKDEAAGLRLQNEAAGIWSKGFDEEDPFALTAIGVALFQGKVVPQDKAQAAQLYKKAADMDFAPAQFNYAMCAKDGQGIPKNKALCEEYLSKAAKSGYRLAQEALGQPATATASNSSVDSSELESQASAGPISGGLNLQLASTSSPATPPAAPPLANAGPISGSFSLGGEGPSASGAATAGTTTKQLTVTGIGVDPAGAEKQAITDAVRQAVGALIDSNTLVQNEEVIRDRILSVSTGFVKEYKPTAPARKRDDGLYEITILATVATNEVAQKLKENNLISGEVAGQNLWAEASTKVMNAQDAVAMLQAKMPELIKSCVTITPLDENGKPMINKDSSGLLAPSMKPAQTKENPEAGKVTLTWFFETGVDKKYYRETFIPLVKECMDAIYGPATLVKQEISKKEENKYSWSWDDPIETDFFTAQIAPRHYDPILIHSITKSFDRIEYYSYLQKKYFVDLKWENVKIRGESGSFILVELIDNKGETIASKEKSCWNPFHLGFNMIGINSEERRTYAAFQSRFITKVALSIPIDSLREVSKVQVALEVHNPILTLKSRDR